MKKLLCAFLVSLMLPFSSPLATPGDVSKTIRLPFHHPTGITFDGKYMWVADRGTDRFYRIDYRTGAVTDSLESPGYFPSGLAWDGTYLWSTDPAEGRIYATDTKTGLTVRSLESPTPSPMGIAWDGKFIWICDNRSDRILKIDSQDGTTITSFRSPAQDPRGIAFGMGYIWCSDRIRDLIYMVHPENGHVVMILDAPGPFSWGLAWRKNKLVNTDYQRDSVFEIVVRDTQLYRTNEPRRAVVEFTTEVVVLGTGEIAAFDLFYAVPSDRPNQKILTDLTFSPAPHRFTEDQWSQRIAVFHYESLRSPDRVEVSMRADIETSAIRYFIFPEDVGDKVPAGIDKLYLSDDIKFDICTPYIQKLVAGVTGDETNIYWKARLLYQYLIENMEYELAGGWNTAPTVLKRGTGSCSEYSFCFIALCRAAGVPARYVGSLVVRGDDASYDDVFHRWCEIYLPGYGWVPVDPSRGDRDWPGDQCEAFGAISNRFLVTTEGGGNSKYLGWGYNYDSKLESSGKCRISMENMAEWEPVTGDE